MLYKEFLSVMANSLIYILGFGVYAVYIVLFLIMSTVWHKKEVVQRFREYLKIESVQPDVDYTDCVEFLIEQADYVGLAEPAVYEPVAGKPVVVFTWEGTSPDLPTIFLNSHMDVVPVYEEHWEYPPFEAHITEDGWIYARGSQDMKSVGMIYLEAVRKLKQAGFKPKKTVHICFVPDEEIGSAEGMGAFVETQEFEDLNVGFGLDESVPSDEAHILIAFNVERTNRRVKITCKGQPGHGSLMPSDTAGEKINFMINKFMDLRKQEKEKLDSGTLLGNVTTINLTKLEGGVQVNVLPEELSAYFDIRVSPEWNLDAFDNMILDWCKEAGDGVTAEIGKTPLIKATAIGEDSHFYQALKMAVRSVGLILQCTVCPGTTNSRFLRMRDIPAIGFTPLLNTPLLLHADNERVNVVDYEIGIETMEAVIKFLTNVD